MAENSEAKKSWHGLSSPQAPIKPDICSDRSTRTQCEDDDNLRVDLFFHPWESLCTRLVPEDRACRTTISEENHVVKKKRAANPSSPPSWLEPRSSQCPRDSDNSALEPSRRSDSSPGAPAVHGSTKGMSMTGRYVQARTPTPQM